MYSCIVSLPAATEQLPQPDSLSSVVGVLCPDSIARAAIPHLTLCIPLCGSAVRTARHAARSLWCGATVHVDLARNEVLEPT